MTLLPKRWRSSLHDWALRKFAPDYGNLLAERDNLARMNADLWREADSFFRRATTLEGRLMAWSNSAVGFHIYVRPTVSEGEFVLPIYQVRVEIYNGTTHPNIVEWTVSEPADVPLEQRDAILLESIYRGLKTAMQQWHKH